LTKGRENPMRSKREKKKARLGVLGVFCWYRKRKRDGKNTETGAAVERMRKSMWTFGERIAGRTKRGEQKRTSYDCRSWWKKTNKKKKKKKKKGGKLFLASTIERSSWEKRLFLVQVKPRYRTAMKKSGEKRNLEGGRLPCDRSWSTKKACAGEEKRKAAKKKGRTLRLQVAATHQSARSRVLEEHAANTLRNRPQRKTRQRR